jgi:hypothetical protein
MNMTGVIRDANGRRIESYPLISVRGSQQDSECFPFGPLRYA